VEGQCGPRNCPTRLPTLPIPSCASR